MNALPFENVPNPRFFYPTEMHEEALERMNYVVVQGKGAGMFIGDIGCGKTIIGRTLTERLLEEGYHVVSMTNPALPATAFLQMIASLYNASGSKALSKTKLWQSLEDRLKENLAHGKGSVLIIDEAQGISDKKTLDELRMLLNLQMDDAFLVNVLLLGQNELEANIDKVKPLKQRMAIRFRLQPLPFRDTFHYIKHRLKVSGCRVMPFDDEAVSAIFSFSKGVPRMVNNLCDRSLLAAFLDKKKQVSKDIVEEAWNDLGYGDAAGNQPPS